MTTSASEQLRPPRSQGAELARLFSPRSIAIIGASADPAKFSGRFVPYLQRHGFAGAIYPINARRDDIGGVRCYPELGAVPGEVECVIYAAAAGEAQQALAACASKGVRLIVMTSAGFAERGDDEGRRMESALADLARRSGARLLGPNCVGFLNAVQGIAAAAAAAFEWEPPLPRGRIGVASQSGGLAMASIILGGWSEGIGFSHVLSTGNEADLDIVDAGRFLLQEENTDAICLTIEAVRDGPAFLVLLCYKRNLAFTRRQHGHRGSVASKSAAIRNRKVVMDDGTWRCVRWAAARFVMRG